MHGTDQELLFIQSTVPEIEDYLLSNVLFWPVSGKGGKRLTGDTSQLTIGNLLLSVKRLKSTESLPEEDRREVAGLSQEIDQIRNRWRSNWDKKAGEEIRSRLKQWDHYLSEITQSSGTAHGDYAYNIRTRVILELLFADVGDPLLAEKAVLYRLDQRLKTKIHQAGFVWDQTVEVGFPESTFWYLYRMPA